MKNFIFIIKKRAELLMLIGALGFSAFTFGFNMFNYPYYENDEGTYMAQAWAVISQGKLAPYTYWYDHSPVGWFLIAAWEVLTGGFYTFGFSINSGRVLMMVLHIATALLIYIIAKKISGSKIAAMLSLLIFSLSPLGLSFQRRVLLDNIMIFWFLLSYNLILGSGRKLHHYILSALFYAVSVLSKESTIFFLPIMLLTVHMTSHASHKIFALWKWFTITTSIISLYFLYAILKGEFFPYGSILGKETPHVSLVETFQFQLSRKGGFFLNQDSGFMLNFKEWIHGGFFIPVPDPVIILLGIVATILISVWSIFDRKLLAASLPTLVYWLFLVRGGEIIGFYIIPLIPLLALCIGLSIYKITNLIPKGNIGGFFKIITTIILTLPFIWYYSTHLEVYNLNQTKPQIEALKWISENLPKESIVVMDNYAYVEFYERNNNIYDLPKIAHYYWKADKDPDVKDKVLKGNWENIDYILSTPQVKYDAENAGLPLIEEAMKNSVLIKNFEGNKWNIEVRKIVKQNDHLLNKTWNFYKTRYISENGQVIDPHTKITTSEGQSYALLRAVWIDDKETFDRVLSWTIDNLQSQDHSLFSWRYGVNGKGIQSVLDTGVATDADQDIALALLFASKRWNDENYLKTAKMIISDLWDITTVEVKNRRYVVAGNWASDPRNSEYTINPSYLSPYAYRIFARIDTNNNWMSVVDTSYEILELCSAAKLNTSNSIFLPPDWCNITKNGTIVESNNIGKESTNYSYDALRIPWRISIDYIWNNEIRAKDYLEKITLFDSEWTDNKKIYSTYSHSGSVGASIEAISQYAGQLARFKIVNGKIAKEIYDQKIKSSLTSAGDEKYWGDPDNYYDQNWAWFGTSLYMNQLPNLWEQK